MPDLATDRAPVVTADLDAIGLPGVVVIVDPDEADSLGAHIETALSPEDAWASNEDE